MLGYDSPEQLLENSVSGGVALNPELLRQLTKVHPSDARRPGGQVIRSDVVWKRRDGTPIIVGLRGRMLRDESGNPACFEMIAEDVTAQRRAQQRIAQLNRLYSVLSHAGQAIARLRDKTELFREICRVVVEEGRFQMAWVGLVDAGLDVKPAAHCGDVDGYLQEIRVTALDEPNGQGPVGRAIRECRHIVCDNVSAEPGMACWQEQVNRRNFRAIGAFPLLGSGRAVGALAIYAPDPAFFDDENVALLDELVLLAVPRYALYAGPG
jgi:PAS domain S-box-containing protein